MGKRSFPGVLVLAGMRFQAHEAPNNKSAAGDENEMDKRATGSN